jgi:exopolysaccharide biosynthesis polyprenyl glycosylphosphotransferase
VEENVMKKLGKLSILFLTNSALLFLCVSSVYKIFLQNGSGQLHQTKFEIFLIILYFLIYFVLMWKGVYSKKYNYYSKYVARIVIRNLIISSAAVLVLMPLLVILGYPPTGGSRILFVLPFLSAAVFCAIHLVEFGWIRYLSKLGYFKRNIMLVGKVDDRYPVDLYFQDLGNSKQYEGTMQFENGTCLWKNNGSVRSYKSFEELLFKKNIGEIIIFMTSDLEDQTLLKLVRFCRTHSITYTLVPDVERLRHESPWNKPFPYIPVIEVFQTPRDSLTCISVKRWLDIIIAALAFICFIPAGIIIALFIALEDRGPVFYVTKRIGKNGKPITFYKFRTMVLDAEKRKNELLRYNERKDGPLFKMKNDPRVTRVGRILRKYNLDEIPQLLNVLIGNLSIVGPRPHLPEEVTSYTDSDYLRLECMPGIVCLPQVSGRKDTIGFREWVRYDLKYRRNWSNKLDLKIMIQAGRVVLAPLFARTKGRY